MPGHAPVVEFHHRLYARAEADAGDSNQRIVRLDSWTAPNDCILAGFSIVCRPVLGSVDNVRVPAAVSAV